MQSVTVVCAFGSKHSLRLERLCLVQRNGLQSFDRVSCSCSLKQVLHYGCMQVHTIVKCSLHAGCICLYAGYIWSYAGGRCWKTLRSSNRKKIEKYDRKKTTRIDMFIHGILLWSASRHRRRKTQGVDAGMQHAYFQHMHAAFYDRMQPACIPSVATA